MDIKKTIGQRINSALAVRGTKQKELAQVLEVTDNTISYFCSGSRTPNLSQLKRIAEHLDVSSDYLLGLTDNITADKDLDAVCKYTGLSEASIKNLDFLRELDSNGLLKLFNLFVSDIHITSLMLKFLQYCKASEEYRYASTIRENELERLRALSGGDVLKEVQLRSTNEIEITYNQVQISDLLDHRDLAEYNLNRSFMALACRIAEKYSTEQSSVQESDV